MIRRPPSIFRRYSIEAQCPEIELVDEDIDHPNGLLPSIQSSRHSGKSVLWPRSVPSMKRFIRSPTAAQESPRPESHEARRFHTTRVIRDISGGGLFTSALPSTSDILLSRGRRRSGPISDIGWCGLEPVCISNFAKLIVTSCNCVTFVALSNDFLMVDV